VQVKELEEQLVTKQNTIDEMAAANAELRRNNRVLKQHYKELLRDKELLDKELRDKELRDSPAKRPADRSDSQQQSPKKQQKKDGNGNGNGGTPSTKSPAGGSGVTPPPFRGGV
jgi:TolA-binding protein